jgi:hypothetical protein
MIRSTFLVVSLFAAVSLAQAQTQVPQITRINYVTGRFETTNHLLFSAFTPRAIARWHPGDQIWSHFESGACGNDPNAYLMHDEEQDESACVLRIGR